MRISTSTRTSLVYKRLSLPGLKRKPVRTFKDLKRRLTSARLITCSSTSQRRLPPACDTAAVSSASRCGSPRECNLRATSTSSAARSGNMTKRSSNRRGATSGANASGPSSANINSALHAATGSVASHRTMPAITSVALIAKSRPTRCCRHLIPTSGHSLRGPTTIIFASRIVICNARKTTHRKLTNSLYLGSTTKRTSVRTQGSSGSMILRSQCWSSTE
mmetsp:Transcript_115596/g.338145  ORF Transcript_115596/g.338145 Transcript_115596/m.338145 type:complete len:220 (-) Transcript_115596:225-884(-)